MLNYLWAAMIFIGVITGACTGHMQEVSSGFVDASAEAVELCIASAGIVALWTGVLKIAEKAGLLDTMNRILAPVIHCLFPAIPKNHPAASYGRQHRQVLMPCQRSQSLRMSGGLKTLSPL